MVSVFDLRDALRGLVAATEERSPDALSTDQITALASAKEALEQLSVERPRRRFRLELVVDADTRDLVRSRVAATMHDLNENKKGSVGGGFNDNTTWTLREFPLEEVVPSTLRTGRALADADEVNWPPSHRKGGA